MTEGLSRATFMFDDIGNSPRLRRLRRWFDCVRKI